MNLRELLSLNLFLQVFDGTASYWTRSREMAENSRGQFGERFVANVHSKPDDFARRIKELEIRLNEVSKAVDILSAWHKFELRERGGGPETRDGRRVIGRIPIWGSGRYLLVLKTPKGSFELDIV